MNESDRPAHLIDTRPPLEGGNQRKAVLALAGGAVAVTVMAIAFVGGPSERGVDAVETQAAVAPDVDRLRAYEQQVLRQARADSADSQLETMERDVVGDRARAVSLESRTYGERGIDPERSEALMRERESLFAGNVVLTKRQEGQRLGQVSSRVDASARTPQSAPTPSLDEVTESVVRAFGRPQATGPLPEPPPARGGVAAAQDGRPEAGQHRVFEGTILDAVLTNRLDGSSSAPVNALVTAPVYAQDGALVVPAGARVLGTTSPVEGFGESRLAVAFHRLLLPNGTAVSLNKFVGLNIRGDSGLKDQVNNHYVSTFGAAAAVGLIGGLSQAIGSGWGGQDNTTIILGGAGDAASNAAVQVMGQYLNRPPTVTIREGHRLKVYLTSDLDLQEYQR